jgi:uncharacterized membrane protein
MFINIIFAVLAIAYAVITTTTNVFADKCLDASGYEMISTHDRRRSDITEIK